MNFFKQKSDEPAPAENDSKCVCHGKQGIFLDKRQTSRSVALLLIIGVFVFIGGYFWGQRVAIDQLLNTVERDSFADQIYYSMCSLYDQKDDENNEPESTTSDEENDTVAQVVHDEGVVSKAVKEPVKESIVAQQVTQTLPSGITGRSGNQVPLALDQKNGKQYYAQLAGFGAQKSADELVRRLEKKGVAVKVVKRQSKTAREKSVAWYQVVTKNFSDRAQLNAAVDMIKKSEKLHDIRVVENV